MDTHPLAPLTVSRWTVSSSYLHLCGSKSTVGAMPVLMTADCIGIKKYLQSHSCMKTDRCTTKDMLWCKWSSGARDSCAEDRVIRNVCACLGIYLDVCVCGCTGEYTGLQTASGPVRSSVRPCPISLTREDLDHGGAVLSSYALVCTHCTSTQDALITHHIGGTLKDANDKRRHSFKVRIRDGNWTTLLFFTDPVSLMSKVIPIGQRQHHEDFWMRC